MYYRLVRRLGRRAVDSSRASLDELTRPFHASLSRVRLAHKFPVLARCLAQRNEEKNRILNTYRTYITSVSSPDEALSAKSCVFLYCLCLCIRPASILDLGSGISSFVFRYYASLHDSNCIVTSVDLDTTWLKRTEKFCDGEGVNTGSFMSWDNFATKLPTRYDLVFFDLTPGLNNRGSFLPYLNRCMGGRSFVVFDDCHYPHYLAQVRGWIGRMALDSIPLYQHTTDEFRRYMLLAWDTRDN